MKSAPASIAMRLAVSMRRGSTKLARLEDHLEQAILINDVADRGHHRGGRRKITPAYGLVRQHEIDFLSAVAQGFRQIVDHPVDVLAACREIHDGRDVNRRAAQGGAGSADELHARCRPPPRGRAVGRRQQIVDRVFRAGLGQVRKIETAERPGGLGIGDKGISHGAIPQERSE